MDNIESDDPVLRAYLGRSAKLKRQYRWRITVFVPVFVVSAVLCTAALWLLGEGMFSYAALVGLGAGGSLFLVDYTAGRIGKNMNHSFELELEASMAPIGSPLFDAAS